MIDKPVEVIIVGAGTSGLYAATLLAQRGITYRLFEASERMGGRLLSSPAGANGMSTDLGAAWFWPHQSKVQSVLNTLDIKHFAQYVEGAALYQLDANTPPQHFDGAAGLSYRIKGGAAAIPEYLAAKLDLLSLHFSHALTQLTTTKDGWQANFEHAGKPIQQNSQFLLLAAPPRILLQRTNLPEILSPQLQQNLSGQQTWMAAQAKFVATYDKAFWREAGLAGDAFSRIGPMTEIHDASADKDAGYALFGFIGLPAAQRRQLTDVQLSQHCLQQLAQLFGDEALNPTSHHLKDWAKESWICSDADIDEPLNHPSMNLAAHEKELASLKLRFASTEVARQEAGYIEGALLAAEQAVADIANAG